MIKFKVTDKAAWSDRPVEVSCGQCTGCRLERARQWAVRCVHESKMHDQNCFLTLTYNDDELPRDFSLDVTHWQKFAKKLRHAKGPFRFFHCGEYGDLTYRPHYHAAIFGLDFREDRTHYKNSRGGEPLFNSPSLDKIWGHGYAVIGQLTFNSAAYVARYIMKKVNGDLADTHYDLIDYSTGQVFERKPEYTTMSRRPGIGKTWFDQYVSDVYPSDQVISNGHPARPPKFYDSQFELIDSGAFEALKAKRASNARKRKGDKTPERLQQIETVQKAKLNLYRRSQI